MVVRPLWTSIAYDNEPGIKIESCMTTRQYGVCTMQYGKGHMVVA